MENNRFTGPHVQIRHLDVYYDHQQTLKDINLDIPRNQITVILGPSGCGKTTLLKSINRFLDLSENVQISGQILVDGDDIYDPKIDVIELRKRIGLLAQRPYSLPMSIYDNVAYGMRLHHLCNNKNEMDQRIQHYLEEAGLWSEIKDRLHQPAVGLSVGQQQRLCLARGLAVEPEIILGDEITSALDPISAQHIEKRLLDLKKHYSIVIVTHILRQAKRLADHVIFMYLGEVVEQGPAHEVFNNPREQRTKAYMEGQF
ncbi:MAG TPA: phosphate ABC transporter ATP-binding protein [Anaerolineaceae bacterium]|nr:phosphate ABC transporter ATP-binding protein [Anaerolineaceae bacterium]